MAYGVLTLSGVSDRRELQRSKCQGIAYKKKERRQGQGREFAQLIKKISEKEKKRANRAHKKPQPKKWEKNRALGQAQITEQPGGRAG